MRLPPGSDLRATLEALACAPGALPAFVVAGLGSLAQAQLRLADAKLPTAIDGPLEILALSGSVCADGAHLHTALADAAGRVIGGHVAPGCTVHTTVELLLADLPGWLLHRRHDAATGYPELVIEPCPAGSDAAVPLGPSGRS